MSPVDWIALVLVAPPAGLVVVTLGIWLNTRLARHLDRRDRMDPFQERAFVGKTPGLTQRTWGLCVEGYWQSVAFVFQSVHAVRKFGGPELRPGEGPLVVLVAGYLENGGLLWLLARRLRARGFQTAVLDLPSTLRRLEDNVDFLHELLPQLTAKAGVERCVLVGHSMGGVIGRSYVHRHTDHPVSTVISLCSPHRGTQIARLGLGSSARDMRPGSDHMRRYPPSRMGATPVHTLISTQDNIVAPPWATVLLEGENVVLDEPVGHVAPVFMRSVADRVAAWAELAQTAPARTLAG